MAQVCAGPGSCAGGQGSSHSQEVLTHPEFQRQSINQSINLLCVLSHRDFLQSLSQILGFHVSVAPERESLECPGEQWSPALLSSSPVALPAFLWALGMWQSLNAVRWPPKGSPSADPPHGACPLLCSGALLQDHGTSTASPSSPHQDLATLTNSTDPSSGTGGSLLPCSALSAHH